MRIGIDGHNLAIPKGTGVATYGSSLATILIGQGHQIEGVFGLDPGTDPQMTETQFFDQFGHGRQEKKTKKRVKRSVMWNHRALALTQVPLTDRVDKRDFVHRWPDFSSVWTAPLMFEIARARFMYLRRFTTITMPNPPAVMHWTYPVPVRMAGSRNIYTLHDLVPLKFPHMTLDDKAYYARLIRGCIAHGDHILTVSEASRRDIVDMFDIADDKITNTYQSSPLPADVAASSTEEDCAIVERIFGLPPKGFYLFFGAQDPKKNVARIIDGYLLSDSKRPLVVITSRNWGMDGTMGALGADGTIYGRKPDRPVIILQYLPRDMLFRLVRAARAVLFPSIYEGFGLPALEAIQLGTLVIASNAASLPEVVGDAGLQVDPYSTDAIADAIRRIDHDQALHDRLSAAAPAQAAKFTDAHFFQSLRTVYDKLGLP